MTSSVPIAGGGADMVAAAADADVTQPAAVPGRRCRNCDALAELRYCPVCGQATALHPPTVGAFVHELVGHHIAFEGPLWHTLAALLLRPGRLTIDYFAGRRQRYIAPLRLYLTFSLILFAASTWQGQGLRLGNESVQFRPLQNSEKEKVLTFARLTNAARGDGPIDRMLARVESLTPEQRNDRISAGVKQYLPYVLIVLVPVLALLLKGLYWNRGLLYGEHLVVAFHAQTVAFFFAIASALPMGDVIGSMWVVALIVHGAIALRRVYGGGWVSTVVREAILMIVYSIVVGSGLAALATASLLL